MRFFAAPKGRTYAGQVFIVRAPHGNGIKFQATSPHVAPAMALEQHDAISIEFMAERQLDR